MNTIYQNQLNLFLGATLKPIKIEETFKTISNALVFYYASCIEFYKDGMDINAYLNSDPSNRFAYITNGDVKSLMKFCTKSKYIDLGNIKSIEELNEISQIWADPIINVDKSELSKYFDEEIAISLLTNYNFKFFLLKALNYKKLPDIIDPRNGFSFYIPFIIFDDIISNYIGKKKLDYDIVLKDLPKRLFTNEMICNEAFSYAFDFIVTMFDDYLKGTIDPELFK